MSIIIETEKTWLDEKRFRKILDLKALKQDELPDEYLKNRPHFYYSEHLYGTVGFYLIDHNPINPIILLKGESVEESQFQGFLERLKRCGERLSKINLKNSWKGMEVIKI